MAVAARVKLVAYVDGGAHPNPGGQMGVGVSIHEPAEGKAPGKLVAEVSEAPAGKGTNNMAEYIAVQRALEECKRLGATELLLRSDSSLVVNQLTGKFRIVDPRLREMAVRINKLAETFDQVSFEWLPREETKVADALATKAIRGVLGGEFESGTKYVAKAAKPPAAGPRREALGSKETEKLADRFSVKARECPKCGKPCTFKWQRFADGSWHVRQECPEHGYVRYTPNEEPFLTLAGKRPS